MDTTGSVTESDLLEGVAAIGAHMRWKPRRVHHLIETEGLPVFKLGGRICARRSSLDRWLAEREAAAQQSSKVPPEQPGT